MMTEMSFGIIFWCLISENHHWFQVYPDAEKWQANIRINDPLHEHILQNVG